MSNPFLKYARLVVESVTSQVTNQINIMEEQVKAPAQNFISMVEGGIWKGNGANRFVQAVTEELLPPLMSLGLACVGIKTNLGKASSIIEDADTKVTSAVANLADTFDSI